VPLSNRYALHWGAKNSREKVVCVSYWAEVGSPPNETSASLMEVMLREAGILVLVSEPALAKARRLPEDKNSWGSW
jgi:hypothetical protein